MSKRFLAVTAALGLAVSPVIAQAAPPSPQLSPAAESVSGLEEFSGNTALIALVVFGLIVVAIAVAVTNHGSDHPLSP